MSTTAIDELIGLKKKKKGERQALRKTGSILDSGFTHTKRRKKDLSILA